MKTCRVCKVCKPKSSEFFHVRKDSKDGFRNECKDCRNARERVYRKENKDIISQYYEDNREIINERKRQHYHDNKDYYLEYKKDYRENNKEIIKEYYQDNKERIKIYGKIYHRENPHISRQKMQRRLARQSKVLNNLTIEQWNDIKNHFNNQCAYCGMTEQEHLKVYSQALHQEHIVPLTKGGGYTSSNILPSCKSCNSQKNNSDFLKWYRSFEYYDKDKELKILNHINTNKKSSLG